MGGSLENSSKPFLLDKVMRILEKHLYSFFNNLYKIKIWFIRSSVLGKKIFEAIIVIKSLNVQSIFYRHYNLCLIINVYRSHEFKDSRDLMKTHQKLSELTKV